MSATFKTSESKREEFRKYLEKEGVLDALTETLGKKICQNHFYNDKLFLAKSRLHGLLHR